MPYGGLVARGSKLCARARTLLLALAWPTLMLGGVSCGSGDGKHQAVECRLDEDCEGSDLGVCDVATCVEGRCQLDSQPDGHRCDDSDPLTGEDACVSGICAGVATTCEDDLGPCLKAVHDPESDECVVEPVEDGAPCDDDDACTQRDSCEAGACVGAEPKTCEALDDCHVAGECDAETGECGEPQAEDGTACDDGLLCTIDDVCQDGACGGSEPECDDGLTCSVDSCDEASGSCSADVTSCSCERDQDCDDGNLCNGAEYCDLGSSLCQAGTATVCPDSTDPCLRNVCVAETGACEPTPTANGTACDDANACTGQDTCQSGVCLGSGDVVCTALSQCHTPGSCDPLTGACDHPEKPANAACNDADACTATDTCHAGECIGSGQVTCQPSDQCHDAGSCNAQTGGCSNPVKPDGVGCDDANLCTGGDACQAGVCVASSQTSCAPLDGCHLPGRCEPATGNCSTPKKPDGSSCNDNSLCTPTDTCTNGTCGGAIKSCDDGVACTVDSCSDKLGGCDNDREDCPCTTSADCNDGNACNGTETCNLQTLQCVPGTAVNCSAFDDACNVGVCSPTSGACSATPKQNGTNCDDADACTPSSSCQAGVCQGANRKTCTATDQCHQAGSCNAATGVCSNPIKNDNSACNDGDACTRGDNCQAGKCTAASTVVCSASDDCHTVGVCNKSTGMCSNPAKGNGSACSDANPCTTADNCQGGVCQGSPKACPASDQCHQAGVCDPASGTCNSPIKANGTACIDDSVCTLTDTCQNGTCTGTNPQVCRASDQCHLVGTCDKTLGCSDPAKPDGTSCVDPSKCTTNDTCKSGVCGGDPVVCKPSDQCHAAGTCEPASGACSDPPAGAGTGCNDGNACTTGETCDGAGTCSRGNAVVCPTPPVCKVSVCDPLKGCGTADAKAGTVCDDGKTCTQLDACARGLCSGVPRNDFDSDWADDPGYRATSVDTFTDKAGSAVIVGAQTATIRFNDKDDNTFTELPLPDKTTVGIYWAVYKELDGAIANVASIASGIGELTVAHAAGHVDGSFTVLGTVQGDIGFGRAGTIPFPVSAKEAQGFVAHYKADGSIGWVALMLAGQSSFSVDAVAAFDDGAVIATGNVVGGLVSFQNAKGGEFAKAEGSGVWAARFAASGAGQWGGLVVRPAGSATAHAVTTHEDGGASFTGGFQGSAALGLGGLAGELSVSVSAAELRAGGDIWYEKLDEKGNIKWGGRVGGTSRDVPGDIARAKAGGALLLANVLGAGPNAEDPGNKITQPLFATSTGVLQAHVIGIDPSGLLVSDGLIADRNGKGGTRGYQLKRDAGGMHAVGGTFTSRTDLWSGLGFGSNAPPVAGIDLLLDSSVNGPSTLFAARVDPASSFDWAVAAGGDNSGMATGSWDIVMTGHASNAVTLAGMFKGTAKFGDAKELSEEELSADVELGNPFVVHLNSEAEHDYCP